MRLRYSAVNGAVACTAKRKTITRAIESIGARQVSNLQPDRFAPARSRRCYSQNNRLALLLRILILSSSHSGMVSIHCTAGLLATNGRSTANKMPSMPLAITQQSSAGLEKLPLMVM
jgi:hypothetical protein